MKHNQILDWILKYNMRNGITIREWQITKTTLICTMSDGSIKQIKLSSIR